jgi:muconolactone delta-isomerase
MLFLVELDHVKSGVMPTPEAGRAFIEQIIFPTLARARQLVAEKKIVAGGPVTGRIALRFIVEADSPQEVDRIITSLPLWTVADTRVTPLIEFSDRQIHVQMLLDMLTTRMSKEK